MIYTSAPLRITFAGGGSDYKNFYEIHGGAFFGSAINKRVHVFINPLSKFSNEKIRFTYRITESVDSLNEIQHPVVREALRYFKISELINIATMADIPGNTGLGSSSAFTVALVAGLAAYKDVTLNKMDIANIAYTIERELIGEAGGIQDQLQASFGGMRLYKLGKQGISISNSLLEENKANADAMEEHMLLLRFGNERHSHEIAKITGNPDKRSLESLRNTALTALNSFKSIEGSMSLQDNYHTLCDAINNNWKDKLSIQQVNKLEHQDFLNEMESYGVDAMKICGAGESGFLLILGTKQVLQRIKNSEYQSQIMDFSFDSHGVIVNKLH